MKLLIAICTASLSLAACAGVAQDDGHFQSGPRPADRSSPFPDDKWVGESGTDTRCGDKALSLAPTAHEGFHPNPDDPITVDFVEFDRSPRRRGFNPVPGLERMPFGSSMFGPWDVGGTGPDDPFAGRSGKILSGTSLRTALHRLVLGTRLQVVFEGTLDLKLAVDVRSPSSEEEAIEILKSICKANGLDFIQDDNVIIIKKRPIDEMPANVVAVEDGRFNVLFENHGFVSAILETANVSRAQVFVPSELSRPLGAPQPRYNTNQTINLNLKNATPEEILRELARLGGMEIEVIALENAAPGFEWGYKFSYKQ
jgi:hypothetical protein